MSDENDIDKLLKEINDAVFGRLKVAAYPPRGMQPEKEYQSVERMYYKAVSRRNYSPPPTTETQKYEIMPRVVNVNINKRASSEPTVAVCSVCSSRFMVSPNYHSG